jgi:hypothetical protein
MDDTGELGDMGRQHGDLMRQHKVPSARGNCAPAPVTKRYTRLR